MTIVATGWMVGKALAAAEALAAEGIEAEVIDPRTLEPLDTATILDLGGEDRAGWCSSTRRRATPRPRR